MKITFEQTVEDYAAFNYYYYSKNRSWQKIVQYCSMALIAAALSYLLYNGIAYPERFSLFPTLFIAAYLVYAVIARSRWGFLKRTERMLKSGRNANAVGERTLIFENDKLVVVAANSETSFSWEGFKYLKETPKYLFLFTTVNQAIIIPKRIFLLEQELYDVKSFIEQKLTLK